MKRSVGWMLGLGTLASLGCGEDEVPGAGVVFERLCGQEGPVPLLALEDDEHVRALNQLDESGELFVLTGALLEAQPPNTSTDLYRRVVVDPCGEVVAEPTAEFAGLTRWDGILIGCKDQSLMQLADFDDDAPVVLARGCWTTSIGDGHVAFDLAPDAESGRLLWLTVDGGTLTVQTLLEDVAATGLDGGGGLEGEMLVKTTDNRLVRVNPAAGTTAVEVEDAGTWAASKDTIAYRAPELAPQSDPWAPTPVIVHDRHSEAEEVLALTGVRWLSFTDDQTLAIVTGDSGTVRLFRTDPLRELVLPQGTRATAITAEGLVWLETIIEGTTIDRSFFRWREGEALGDTAYTCRNCSVGSTPEGLEIWLMLSGEPQEMWRLLNSGGPAELVARRPAGSNYSTVLAASDGVRLIVTQDEAQTGRGRLVAYGLSPDPDGLTVATGVVTGGPASPGLQWGDSSAREVLYEGTDGVHALYRARLADPQ